MARRAGEMIEYSQPRLEAEELGFVCLDSGETQFGYNICQYFVDPEVGQPSVPVIQICEIQNKLLVAVPGPVWHRAVSKRILPATALSKPTLVEVGVCTLPDRESPVPNEICRIWIGFLKAELRSQLHSEVENCEFDYFFHQLDDGELCLPHTQGLVDVAQEHFAFFSAGEEVQENQPQIEESGAVDLESRMVIMEDALARMAVGVEKLLEEKKRPSAMKTRAERVTFEPSVAAGSMSSTSAAPKDASSPKKKKVSPTGQLDPAVVAAALQAGIPRESIQQMEMLVGSNAKAKKVKDMNPDVVPIWDPLSEEEEEEAGEYPVEGSGLEGPADPVSRTLSKLAGIMELLTEEKKKKSSSSRLDQVLDAAGSSSGDGLSLGAGKKVAAARRALRTAFQEQPSEVHQAIEKLLYEDLNTATLGPGMKPAGFNARSWVEFRSHIGAYKATAHSAWAIAGVIDSLVAKNYDRARAQACLLLLQLDQSSADHGSWYLAAELSLEGLPPFTTLAQHQAPNLAHGEHPFSKLLEPRWAEIMLGHLREQDDFVQRRRTVGKALKNKEEEDPDVRKRAKVKARPKTKPETTE